MELAKLHLVHAVDSIVTLEGQRSTFKKWGEGAHNLLVVIVGGRGRGGGDLLRRRGSMCDGAVPTPVSWSIL